MKKTVSLIFALMLSILAISMTGCNKEEMRYVYAIYRDNFGNEYRMDSTGQGKGYESRYLHLEYSWQESNLYYNVKYYYADNDIEVGAEAKRVDRGYTDGVIDLTKLGEYEFDSGYADANIEGGCMVKITVVDTRPMPEYKFIPHNYNSKYQWVDCVPNEKYIYKYTGDYIEPPELVLMEDGEIIYINDNKWTVEKFNGTEFIDRDEAEDSSGWRKDVGRYPITYACTNSRLPEEYQNKYCYEINVSIELEIIK